MNINYRQLTKNDLPYFEAGTALIRNSQGNGAVGDQQLEFMSAANECCVFGAFIGQDLVGVASGGILPKNQFDFYACFNNKLSDLFARVKVGILLAVAVNEQYRGSGIGRKLLELRINWFEKNDAQYALTNSWNSKAKFSSPRLFKADGFELLSHFCTYVHPSNQSSACPQCSVGCRCENYVFIKKL